MWIRLVDYDCLFFKTRSGCASIDLNVKPFFCWPQLIQLRNFSKLWLEVRVRVRVRVRVKVTGKARRERPSGTATGSARVHGPVSVFNGPGSWSTGQCQCSTGRVSVQRAGSVFNGQGQCSTGRVSVQRAGSVFNGQGQCSTGQGHVSESGSGSGTRGQAAPREVRSLNLLLYVYTYICYSFIIYM